ncbi:Cmc1p SCDLUD_003988 [Saccharomycodes ludwigii]|uniref:Cmc1p n=1 Tax=Saccharomycodes ludwigii TaxID=36035 RepID=UPI001E8380BF|nr:hypothetical protein SCDLUD_003988 [Saccharomycodes ludwigii]KAH3899703.1 hypothetical protein SCDLUD_003988 [Saccharomycodes ludwigii]
MSTTKDITPVSNDSSSNKNIISDTNQTSNEYRKSHRLPLWVLGPRDEQEARTNLKKMAYEKCDIFIKAMADCAKQNGIKVFPECNPQKEKMAECVLFYQTDEYLDEQRDLMVQKKIKIMEDRLKK